MGKIAASVLLIPIWLDKHSTISAPCCDISRFSCWSRHAILNVSKITHSVTVNPYFYNWHFPTRFNLYHEENAYRYMGLWTWLFSHAVTPTVKRAVEMASFYLYNIVTAIMLKLHIALFTHLILYSFLLLLFTLWHHKQHLILPIHFVLSNIFVLWNSVYAN